MHDFDKESKLPSLNSREDISILHRDHAIIIIEKPCGMLAVPGRGPDKQDCAAARLRRLYPLMIEQPAVHRLDMYTSGLMVFAVTAEAHRRLSLSFSRREVYKEYTAVLQGIVAKNGGEIRLPFRLDPNNRPLQIYDVIQGKMGITLWQKIAVQGETTRVAFKPLTGRTHQLRLHAAHPLGLAAPILGDRLYGTGQEGERMFLHATRLRFFHPDSNKLIGFFSQPPF